MEVVIGQPMPRADEAVIPEEKLYGYVLNSDHADGTHKARVFHSVLGLTASDWETLRDHILEAIQHVPVSAVRPAYNGVRITVEIPARGLDDAECCITTGWRLPDDGSPPHLTTAFIRV
jgi:hypothetical protein